MIVIKTSGDWIPEQGETLLNDHERGKALFAKEIEEALLEKRIDSAVHSMKDMDSGLPAGLVIDHMLPREDPRDCLLFSPALKRHKGQAPFTLADLPHGSLVGTASIRRAAFLLRMRPDLRLTPLRGNVQTRLDKLQAGQIDATLLALAGLRRLALVHHADCLLEPETMLPSAGQGAIGIEIREGEQDISAIFGHISCIKTALCVKAERKAVQALGGSCRAPIGAYAAFEGEELHLQVHVASAQGTFFAADDIKGSARTFGQAEDLGETLGTRLRTRLPEGIFAEPFPETSEKKRSC